MRPYSHLIMLGAAPQTRGSIAAVVEAYRAYGLFTRWPIDYLATHGAGGPAHCTALALKSLARLALLLARHRRAVLHVHTEAYASFWRDSAYAGAAMATRCPVILHLHGGDFDRFHDDADHTGKALIRRVLGHAAGVAAPAQRIVSWVRAVSPGANAVCLPTPVSIPVLQNTPRSNLILFLDDLKQEKGIFDLLEAVSQLRAAVPDVRLACAGAGDHGAVARYAEQLGIADAVKFIGAVGPSGKRALLESAAVCALPSYAEGMPVGLLEAMAAGVPVVASPVGGIPEAVVDGVSGYLAAPGDIATLQRVLRKLLVDRKLAGKVGAAGRETVRLRFAPERALHRLEALYTELGLRPLVELPRPVAADLRKAA